MDRVVYTALSGLRGRMAAQSTIANNIANASTTGFRAERIAFQDLALIGAAFEARMPSSEEVIDFDRAAGVTASTGRTLDVAVEGDDWIAVQTKDGEDAYTRRGELSVAPFGVQLTGAGHPVIGNAGPITLPPSDHIEIASDGSISIVPTGGSRDQPQLVDRVKLASATGTATAKGLDGLLRVKGGGALPDNPDARVRSGALEGSNVGMTAALVAMIENQRSYELQTKLLATTRQLDEGGASLMRLQG